jgi:EpsI family protein
VKPLRVSIAMACLLAAALVVAMLVRPPARVPGSAPRFLLESIVPKQFGQWHELPGQGVQVVNPQTQELLDKLYSQTLTRTYANAAGYRIMLSMAYGDDQRGSLQAHKPEVCYPAQGFTLHSNAQGQLDTPFGAISTRRLSTSLGRRREPVTYWFTVGDTAVKSKLQQRLIEIRLGLTGQVPDGLLVRISSIDDSPSQAFKAQDGFAADLLAAVPALDRVRLSGLGADARPGTP